MASGSSISILILYYSIKNLYIQVCLVGCFVSTENYWVGGAGGGRRERGEGEKEGCVCMYVCVFNLNGTVGCSKLLKTCTLVYQLKKWIIRKVNRFL